MPQRQAYTAGVAPEAPESVLRRPLPTAFKRVSIGSWKLPGRPSTMRAPSG
jgi:hypothetical protein